MRFLTKYLFTALLIAGLPATANAETSVYYCNTQHFAQITDDGVANVKSYPFKMKVDSSRRTVEFKGDVLGGLNLRNVNIWDNGVNFDGSTGNGNQVFVFDSGYLSYTGLIARIGGSVLFYPEGHISKCDKF